AASKLTGANDLGPPGGQPRGIQGRARESHPGAPRARARNRGARRARRARADPRAAAAGRAARGADAVPGRPRGMGHPERSGPADRDPRGPDQRGGERDPGLGRARNGRGRRAQQRRCPRRALREAAADRRRARSLSPGPEGPGRVLQRTGMARGTQRVRVYVADDHPVYREGLVRAIRERPDLELVGEASDGREALPEIRKLEPDVAVLDVRMPGLDGMEVLNAIKRDDLPTRVVFLSAYVESDLVYRAIAMGAGAYLSKEADRAAIFDAVAAVARGEAFLSPEIQTGLTAQIQMREAAGRPVL